MKEPENFLFKDLINELNQNHKELMNLFPGFSLDSCIMYSSAYVDNKFVESETPILRIRIHHHQVLSYEPFWSDESYIWNDICKFENNSIMENDKVFLVFTTPEDFDARLIPERLLIFTLNYSETNKFQIQHHIFSSHDFS